MSRREIEVLVDEDGTVSIEALGYEGSSCEAATEYLERALGQVKTRQRKPEYYRRQSQTNPARAR